MNFGWVDNYKDKQWSLTSWTLLMNDIKNKFKSKLVMLIFIHEYYEKHKSNIFSYMYIQYYALFYTL